jgi:hypothetical protein
MRRLAQTWIIGWLLLAFAVAASRAGTGTYAAKISSLIDPVKLQTLGARGANQRVQKYVALLAEAKAARNKPEKVAAEAAAIAGIKGEAAELTIRQMVRNLKIAERYGCADADALGRMRRGEAPIVMRGQNKGDELSVDHIIPRLVVPELDNVIANLELMPLRLNEKKNAQVGKRQVELGRKLQRAGLLSSEGFRTLQTKASKHNEKG